MSDTAPETRGLTARRAILGILGLQIVLALILAGSDLVSALPRLVSGPQSPALDAPVAPGDQVRRYRPSDLPAQIRTADPSRQTQLPDPGDMPSRLRFALEGDAAILTGQIAPGDFERFAEWLSTAPEVTQARLHSPGGSVRDALAIGAALREAEMGTFLETGDICLSACPYILAGGVTRIVAEDAMVGVHQHYFGENTALPAFLAIEDIQRGQGDVMAHLDAMGVDVRLMRPALATPPDAIYVLLPEELRDYRLITPPEE
ncbi:hypothetical protein V8J82_12045 [Gymnodinialimonas sp. 2305UL16-5]|uniref:COG3904 family protein n=1 Tax=Gymnodinialimonas mytili TaxID=3126503 RepID=UPI00309F5D60